MQNLPSPLDAIKQDQEFFVMVSRNSSGLYGISCQLTRAQYEALGGKKSGALTFKRWQKDGREEVVDRVYVNLRGRTLGYIAAESRSSMIADSEGRTGGIFPYLPAMEQDLANEVAQVLRGE